jgi:hypothetical protein
MRIDNCGNVGIGTTDALSRLQVNHPYNGSGANLYLYQPCSTWGSQPAYNAYKFISTCSDSSALDGMFKSFNVGPGGVSIGYTQPPTYNCVAALYVCGHVGIGTNSPGSILHVKGGSDVGADFGAELRVWENSFGAVLQGSTIGNTKAFLGNFRYNLSTPASSVTNYYQAGQGILLYDGVHIFASNPGGSSGGTFTPSERLTILNNGNVGIGNPSPGSKLSVDGSLQVNGTITNLGTGTDVYTQSTWYLDTSNQILFEHGRQTNSASGTGRTVYFTWRGGPSVGGGVQLQHGTNAWAAYTSDARLKTKVADVSNGVEAIMKLNPIKFKWTRELENSKTITGFTAQNIEEAIPDAVFNSWTDDVLGDVKSYYQDYLNPYLVKAIQEQQCTIQCLTNRIEQLENK